MTNYVIKRLLLMIPTLFGITFITYVIIRSAPGDPTAMKGDLERGPKRDMLATGNPGDYRRLLHLDKPAPVAYFYWIGDFFNPQLNVSSTYKVYVFDVIFERMPNTLMLNLIALLFLFGVGLPLGVDSAVNARTVRERVLTFLLFLLYSLPGFWVALILIVSLGRGGWLLEWMPPHLFWFRLLPLALSGFFLIQFATRKHEQRVVGPAAPASRLRGVGYWIWLISGVAAWIATTVLLLWIMVFLALKFGNPLTWTQLADMVILDKLPENLRGLPIAGLRPDNAERLTFLTLAWASVPYYLLPVFCSCYGGFAGESRYMRVGLLEILRQDYIRTAYSKGLSTSQVVLRHALPNALTPILVQIAGIFPGMIGGSVIIETIFSIPGMGVLFFDAVLARDYNLIMAEVFMGAVLTLVGILISDLLLPTVDPRITFEARQA